ncbi:MAG: glycosyltransferase family 61 protein [Sphingobacteriaceae bacterium]|nr:MAG: glycosyltransferase family 61 protein [Sphingobacteriaceae bacterium]
MWSDNYYHWLIDALPRLLILAESDKTFKILLPYYTKDYVKLTIDALGFANQYILKIDQTLFVDEVLLPGRTAYGIDQNPQLIRDLRSILIKNLHPVATKPFKFIYASRSRAKTRRLKNEDAIGDILKKYGFTVVYFEEVSFLEQIALMQETKILVGVHGANLTNSLFMQPGCILIELLNQDHPNLVYYHMASSLGLPYFSIPCVAEKVVAQDGATAKIFDSNLNNADYYVEPNEFDEVLRQCIENFIAVP